MSEFGIAQRIAPEHFIEAVPDTVDRSRYVLDDAWEIANALKALVEQDEWLTIHSPALASPCWARLTALDLAAGSFWFATETPLPFTDEALLFVAEQRGVKLQFESRRRVGTITVGLHDAAIPTALTRMQRRSHARIEAPLGLPYLARFKVGGRQIEMGIDNLGLGGVALRASPHDARLLYVGRRIKGVWLELGQGKVLSMELEVRARRPWTSYLLGEQVLVGCRFVDSDEATLGALREALAELTGLERP